MNSKLNMTKAFHFWFASCVVFLELFIERFCMTGGNSPIGYLKAYHTNLYLSADSTKVREALEEGTLV